MCDITPEGHKQGHDRIPLGRRYGLDRGVTNGHQVFLYGRDSEPFKPQACFKVKTY